MDISEIWEIYQCFPDEFIQIIFCLDILLSISFMMKFIFELIVLKFHTLHSKITKREHENPISFELLIPKESIKILN